MNDPEPEPTCQRCGGPFLDQRFTVRIDADPPLANAIGLWVCDRCMESMTRWMTRGERRDAHESGDRDRDRHRDWAAEMSGGGPRKGDGKSRRGRSYYANALDRHDRWVVKKEMLTIAAWFLGVLVLGAFLFYVSLSTGLRRR